jgi:hypothetical protein
MNDRAEPELMGKQQADFCALPHHAKPSCLFMLIASVTGIAHQH